MGALLRVPFLTSTMQIYEALLAAGIDDLTHAHLAVFRHIDEQRGSRLIDLADEAQIAKQSMGYLVDYLEEHGYVERVPDARDGRARLIRLTKHGEAVMKVARDSVRKTEEEWAQYLGSERLDQLREILKDLTAILESARHAEGQPR